MAYCHCGIPARQGFVTKEGANKGKSFLRCSKWPNGQCSFFQWDNSTPRATSETADHLTRRENPIIAPVPQKFSPPAVENSQQLEWKTFSPATRESVEALEQRVKLLEHTVERQNVQLAMFFNSLGSMGKTWN